MMTDFCLSDLHLFDSIVDTYGIYDESDIYLLLVCCPEFARNVTSDTHTDTYIIVYIFRKNSKHTAPFFM